MVEALIILFGLYAVVKFAFFFVLPYRLRRRLLDRQYGSGAHATAWSDRFLTGFTILGSLAVLARLGSPLVFLAGLLFGGTLVQLFFHAFSAPPAEDRASPAPHSPIKTMSYAIQDRPWRAWSSMAVFGFLVIVCVGLWLGGR